MRMCWVIQMLRKYPDLNQINLQAHVLFGLAYASGLSPVQTHVKQTWPLLGVSEPLI